MASDTRALTKKQEAFAVEDVFLSADFIAAFPWDEQDSHLVAFNRPTPGTTVVNFRIETPPGISARVFCNGEKGFVSFSRSIPHDTPVRSIARFPKNSPGWRHEQQVVAQVKNLKIAGRFLGLYGQNVPAVHPEQRAGFIAEKGRLARASASEPRRKAIKLMLDWCAPGWEGEDVGLANLLIQARGLESPYRKWRTAVLDRDGRMCRADNCGAKTKLHAHHIVRWVDSVELRLDVDNGVTLCASCHRKQHRNMKARVWH